MSIRNIFKIAPGLLVGLFLWQTAGANQKESFKELILKSQNLSLQHDRLQACQILQRALQKEPRNTVGYKELKESLESLSTVFYTDQAQAIFAQGEALSENKTKEAIEKFQEALKLEEGNIAILKSLARAQLRIDDCRGAETTLKSAENFDSITAEFQLLKIQNFQCRKDENSIKDALESKEIDLEGVEKYLKVFSIEQSYFKKDYKKAKQLISNWEAQSPEYPEVYFWKWQTSAALGTPDRQSAQKYLQLCKGLSARKRKLFNLDVDLCKGIDEVEAKLKLAQ